MGQYGGMAVKGIGKVVFNSASDFKGGLAIGDTSTVAVKSAPQGRGGGVARKSAMKLRRFG